MMRGTLILALAGLCVTSNTKRLIVGAYHQLLGYDFDATGKSPSLKLTNNVLVVLDSTTGVPSWMIFKEPNIIYVIDEYTRALRLFNYDPKKGKLSKTPKITTNGSDGVVAFDFNPDKTILLCASYGIGAVDIWDISKPDKLVLKKTLMLDGPLGPDPDNQDGHHAHQVLHDPTGRFYAVPDLGSDIIYIVDSKDNNYTIIDRVNVTMPGAGPRHGAFVTLPPKTESRQDGAVEGCLDYGATYYAVICELLNTVILFKISYKKPSGIISFKKIQQIYSYGPGFPLANPKTAAAGELIIANNQKDIYVSNRLTGNATDSIAHFQILRVEKAEGGAAIKFVDSISSGGILPRMCSFSLDDEQKWLYSTNQDGDIGLLAYKRGDNGKLEGPVATVAMKNITSTTDQDRGPQFVAEIPMQMGLFNGIS